MNNKTLIVLIAMAILAAFSPIALGGAECEKCTNGLICRTDVVSLDGTYNWVKDTGEQGYWASQNNKQFRIWACVESGPVAGYVTVYHNPWNHPEPSYYDHYWNDRCKRERPPGQEDP